MKLELSHNEMVVLSSIADQELMFSEIEEELFRLGFYEEEDYKSVLEQMIKKRLVISHWKWVLYYAIAPEVLGLNQPPYSYESWKALSK